MNTLIKHAELWTGLSVIRDATIHVSGGVITYAGGEGAAPQDFFPDQVINARGAIAMPGFCNAHTHLSMTLLRGVGSDLPLLDWLHQIWPIEDKLKPEYVKTGALAAIMEMIRTGTTSAADAYMQMDNVAEVVIDSGFRANICRMVTGEGSQRLIDEQRRLFTDWNGLADGRLRVSVGLHGEYTSDERLARDMAGLAAELGAGIHVHSSETRSETDECRKRRNGMSPTQYFEYCGVFDVPTIAAHCVFTDEADFAIMKRHGVYAVNNTISNLKLGSGIAPVRDMLKHGVTVCIGTDGAASNNVLDMFNETKLSAILQNGVNEDATALPAITALEMAAYNGARAMGYERVGRILPGWKADIVLLDDADPSLISHHDIPSTLVYTARGLDVRMTMVDGRVLYRDGEYLTIDADKVRADFKSALAELLG